MAKVLNPKSRHQQRRRGSLDMVSLPVPEALDMVSLPVPEAHCSLSIDLVSLLRLLLDYDVLTASVVHGAFLDA